ncbi:Zinc ribbon domain-containing protein, partial [Dysosmobacter welbionis]
LQRLQDALHILIGLLSGEAAVVGAERQVEGHALLALRDAGAGVDVEQGHILQQPLGAPADAVLQRSHGDGPVAHHGDVP